LEILQAYIGGDATCKVRERKITIVVGANLLPNDVNEMPERGG
jgi:hypothetical protein